MAFTEFYMTTAGSDVNSGTSTANSAAVTDVGGTYTQGGGAGGGTSDLYAASAGTPFSGVSVGDWASIYTAGATAATYVVKITAVNGGGASIDVDSTKLFGTRAANASTKTCKVGGAWASLALCAAGAILNSGTVTQDTRLNIKAGTYANTTTNRSFFLAGSATVSFVIEGYKTNPQDLESVPAAARVAGTDIPHFTWTTGGFSSGTYQVWANVAVTSATTGTAFSVGQSSTLDRVQVYNTSTGGSTVVCAFTGNGIAYVAKSCRFVNSGTGTTLTTAFNGAHLQDCVIQGGSIGFTPAGINVLIGCKFTGQTAQCISASGGNSVHVDRCTFYGDGGATDAIKWTTTPTNTSSITNCIFDTFTNGVNNAGTATTGIRVKNNDFHTVTNNYVGLQGGYSIGDVTDSSSPFTNAAGGDFTLVTGSSAKAAGSPGMFEGEAYSSYLDIGAYQRQEGGGGGGANLLGKGTLVT